MAELGKSLFPPATNLLSANTRQMTDGQLFWIIKNGLSFTAMPGYASQYRDDAIWTMVIYIRALQQGRALAFGPPPTERSETAQRAALQMTDSTLQPANLTARAGDLEVDIMNQGARGHQLVISAPGKVPFNAGRILPTQSLQLQGKVEAGDYTVAVDPGAASPGPVATLTVR